MALMERSRKSPTSRHPLKSVDPSYKEVAKKYAKAPATRDILVKKISREVRDHGASFRCRLIHSIMPRKGSRSWTPSQEREKRLNNSLYYLEALPSRLRHEMHHLVKCTSVEPGSSICVILLARCRYFTNHRTRSLVEALAF
jgi:hypothetical protein